MRRLQKADPIALWIGLTVVVSIVGWLDGGVVWGVLALSPVAIAHGQVWRLMTFVLLEPSAYPLLLTGAAIYRFGSELLPRWGTRRLRNYVLRIVLVSAGATCLVALVHPPSRFVMHSGGFVVADLLVIGWARQFPSDAIALFGIVRLSGRALVRVTCAITVIYAIHVGLQWMVPSVVACTCAMLYPIATLRRG